MEALIADLGRVEACEGPLYFDRYMDRALYHPEWGYYRQAASPIGARGDFVTLPETTPLFGRTLARVLAELFGAGLERTLIEVGPGSGRLTGQLVGELTRAGVPPAHCILVEPNRALWSGQQAGLAGFGETTFEWRTEPPPAWAGVLVMNEIVDALPIARVEKGGSGWFEWGVGVRSGQLVFEPLPLRAPVGRILAEIEAGYGLLPVGYRTECNPTLGEALAPMLSGAAEGYACVIDYGYSRQHYYHAERSRGTLQCYFRHLVHDDPLHAPGVEDLTAMVDFTALAEVAGQAGFELAGFAPLAPFVLAAGIPAGPDPAAGDAEAHLRWVREVLRLTDPHETGELFKIMMLAKGEVPEVGVFAACDQSDRL